MEHQLISQLHQALKLLNGLNAHDKAKAKVIHSALMNANHYFHGIVNGTTIDQQQARLPQTTSAKKLATSLA